MRHKKGRFISKRSNDKSKNSSTRLKEWHSSKENESASGDADRPSFLSGIEEDSSTPAPPAVPGRRIIELEHVIGQLKHCHSCRNEINLTNTFHEQRYGFGSVLTILCKYCGYANRVETNKRHRSESSTGPPPFVVNTKAALGMLHSGVGYSQMKNFMASVEVPAPHHAAMKQRERKVGIHVRSFAEESCSSAIQEERYLMMNQISPEKDVPTSSNSEDLQENQSQKEGPVRGEFKYDMGWQKRGSGRAYDSKSGVGTMLGNRSGKVCAYGVRIKDCRVCSVNRNKGTTPKHECFKNWTGSSKAMEADVAGELVKKVESENINVSVLIMDDDCTTIARVRKELAHDIEKWSDQNHTVKHLGNSLYKMQTKHKALSPKVIKHLQKCFNYALAQNKGKPDEFQSALKQIVPHMFGDHKSCGVWCGYIKDPENYKHSGLPYGRPLSGESLRTDLNTVFDVFIQNYQKIAPGGSTKDVESFNNMVASKAPKRIHFSGSDSILNRVACAVVQKNQGFSYVNSVNTSIGISPGKIMEKHADRLDRKRKRRSEIENTVSFKRKKLQRKLQMKNDNSSKELREGVTYHSGVANTHISDVTEIPPPQCLPECEKLSLEQVKDKPIVFCDIETSSLHNDADILQIAAIVGSNTFNQYITPTKSIAPSASAVTKLTNYGNTLLYQGKVVQSVPLKNGLQNFLTWIELVKPCILVGHNFHKFDFPRIINAFDRTGLTTEMKAYIAGAVDTYPLFKQKFPYLEKYSQEYLVSMFSNETYNAHNALSDVESLQSLCSAVDIRTEQMLEFSCTTECSVHRKMFSDMCRQNELTMDVLLQHKVLSKGMVHKIAFSGLVLDHIKLAVKRSGLNGLSQLLSEKFKGKHRVTNRKNIIENLFQFVQGLISD